MIKNLEMSKENLQTVLENIKNELNLDFVYWSYGKCCRRCAEFDNEDIKTQYNNANTYLINKFYEEGMNYSGSLEKMDILMFAYHLNDFNQINKVCEMLDKFKDYKVIIPEESSTCIILEKEDLCQD